MWNSFLSEHNIKKWNTINFSETAVKTYYRAKTILRKHYFTTVTNNIERPVQTKDNKVKNFGILVSKRNKTIGQTRNIILGNN